MWAFSNKDQQGWHRLQGCPHLQWWIRHPGLGHLAARNHPGRWRSAFFTHTIYKTLMFTRALYYFRRHLATERRWRCVRVVYTQRQSKSGVIQFYERATPSCDFHPRHAKFGRAARSARKVEGGLVSSPDLKILLYSSRGISLAVVDMSAAFFWIHSRGDCYRRGPNT
jgi:hypothetical protein